MCVRENPGGTLSRQSALLSVLGAGVLEVECAKRGHSHPAQPEPSEHQGQHRGHV